MQHMNGVQQGSAEQQWCIRQRLGRGTGWLAFTARDVWSGMVRPFLLSPEGQAKREAWVSLIVQQMSLQGLVMLHCQAVVAIRSSHRLALLCRRWQSRRILLHRRASIREQWDSRRATWIWWVSVCCGRGCTLGSCASKARNTARPPRNGSLQACVTEGQSHPCAAIL